MNLQSPIVLTCALTVSMLPGIFFLTASHTEWEETVSSFVSKQKTTVIPEISLPTSLRTPEFPASAVLTQLIFSMDPPRPGTEALSSVIGVQFSGCKEQLSVALPARIGLKWDDRGVLCPAEKRELFWLELTESPSGMMRASVGYKTPAGETVMAADWQPALQETPIRSAETFSSSSPFGELVQGRLGPDVLSEKYGSTMVYRLEMGTSSFSIKPTEWLAFKDGKWQPVAHLEEAKNLPIARLNPSSPTEFEGWDGPSYVRFRLSAPALQPLKVRGDELFGQLRVRSEKQVSCMLDKQCLVLRPGDWVLKTENRWKIVRKPEEKAKLLKGSLSGDLIVLDRVEARGSTKSVVGHYIAANRLQCVPIEKTVTSTRRK